MAPRDKRDYQTLNLFLILALLTILFVSGLKVVLFDPTKSAKANSGAVAPSMEESAQK